MTAVFAATIGLVQNDIKKVLAYSTVSQLGYMFLGCRCRRLSSSAIFHVVTHAFFKACLFLGSGSVIHACGGEQDMRQDGRAQEVHAHHVLDLPGGHHRHRRHLPDLRRVLLQGRDPVQDLCRRRHGDLNGYGSTLYSLLWILGMVVGAVMTAFYMFRLVFMTFHGEFRGGEEAEHHLHESPWTMTMPLVVLGVLSIFGGLVGVPGKLFGHPEWNLVERFPGADPPAHRSRRGVRTRRQSSCR